MRALPESGFDEDEVRVAVAETIAAFDVYRTYLRPDGSTSDEDRRIIDEAISTARARATHIDLAIFDALRAALLMEVEPARDLALRFQQTTGPIMAKGVEDTVFYNYNRLVSLNEVGGDPGRFGVGVDEFHRGAERTLRTLPRTMLATSTHDTKRSEDVRARINLLSEIPERWSEALERWSKIAGRHRTDPLPDRNAEYLFFQTLVGAHPLPVERAVEYMRKASKEAKRYTSWIDPRPDYDRLLEGFVRGVLGDTGFMAEVAAFVQPLIEPGRITSLAQTLVRLTHPGIPDTYQGTELWDDSLVDPDNRRPVDYGRRAALLRRIETVDAADLWAKPDDGTPKMLVVARALDLRRQKPGPFGPTGSYARLATAGDRAGNVLAYLRGDDVAVIVPRLVMGLAEGWGDTGVELPAGDWTDVLTGRETEGGWVDLAGLTAAFPVALLTRR
jgi:(1->4)-alpha-D-glucan 1-alpha-D-glucosylmutase